MVEITTKLTKLAVTAAEVPTELQGPTEEVTTELQAPIAVSTAEVPTELQGPIAVPTAEVHTELQGPIAEATAECEVRATGLNATTEAKQDSNMTKPSETRPTEPRHGPSNESLGDLEILQAKVFPGKQQVYDGESIAQEILEKPFGRAKTISTLPDSRSMLIINTNGFPTDSRS